MKESMKEIARELRYETNLFHLLNDDELERVAPFFERAQFASGAQVFKEGDPGNFIGFVKSGTVEVKKATEFEGKQIILAQMGKGSILGELAVFDESARSATVETLTDTELFILRSEALEELLKTYPETGIKLLKGISRVLSMRLRQLADRLVVIF